MGDGADSGKTAGSATPQVLAAPDAKVAAKGGRFLHPILFHLGRLNVYSYGLMLSLAFGLAVVVTFLNSRRHGVDPWLVVDMAPLLFLAGFVGSRLVYVLLNWSDYAARPLGVFATWEGGESFYGAILGGLVVVVAFARRRKLRLGPVVDAMAPGLALAASIGRVGCFLNGCCYGVLTSGSWGVFTRYVPGLRHPTQLYESAAYFGVFLFLLWWQRRAARVPGQLFLTFVGGYLVSRYVVEFFREGQRIYPWLSLTQAASLIIGLAAVVLYVYLGQRAKAAPALAAAPAPAAGETATAPPGPGTQTAPAAPSDEGTGSVPD